MRRKLATLLIALALLVIAAIVFSRNFTLDDLIRHEVQLRDWIRGHPLRAFALGLGIYAVASIVPGTGGKSVVYGWLFGFWQALIIVNIGLTAGATVTFFFGRYMFHDALHSWFGAYLRKINEAFHRDGAFYLITLRLLHVPYTFVNYTMSATSMRPRTFWWATQLGLLPGNAVFVYAGVQLPTLSKLSQHGFASIVSLELTTALVLMGILPLLVRYTLRKFWPQLEMEADFQN